MLLNFELNPKDFPISSEKKFQNDFWKKVIRLIFSVKKKTREIEMK